MQGDRVKDLTSAGLGVALVAGGLLLLCVAALGVSYTWPLIILIPGVVLFYLGLTARAGHGGLAMAIIGSITSATGVLLLYATVTSHWEIMAYGWSLIAPTSVGVALSAFGAIKGQDKLVKAGCTVMTVGAWLFAGGVLFFEVILGISGHGLGMFGWPVMLIAGGLLLLTTAVVKPRLGQRVTA